jgi:stress-induced morphogen
MVNEALAHELRMRVHALAIETAAPRNSQPSSPS